MIAIQHRGNRAAGAAFPQVPGGLLLWFVLLCFTAAGLAQKVAQPPSRQQQWQKQQFRLAQAYQRSNQHKRAVAILERLYKENPGNYRYYSALMESYFQLGLLDKALETIARQRLTDPLNPSYDIDYANALFRKGSVEEAKKLWNQLLEKHPQNMLLINQVANAMLENGLFDETIKTLKWAYRNNPDKTYLLQQIARLYRSRFQYKEAVRYYLQYLEHEPAHYQTVAQQILSLDLEPAQSDTVRQMLQEALKKKNAVPEIRLILAKFYQRHQQYDQALEMYRQVEMERSQGKYLLEFARAAQNDSLFSIALNAYRELIQRFPRSPYLMQAYLGAASTNLALAEKQDDPSHARAALDMIEKVVQQYPGQRRVAQLLLLEGEIYRRFFFDLDKAIAVYSRVAENGKFDPQSRARAHLEMARCQLMRGDLAAALPELDAATALPSLKPRAELLRARAFFFQGQMDTARALLSRVINMAGAAGAVTNDALDLQLVIDAGKTSPEALAVYAQARWLMMQEKKNEALNRLDLALQKNPTPQLQVRVLLDAGRLATQLEDYPRALGYYQQILEQPALQIYADQAVFLTAQLLDRHLQDLAGAYRWYDRLLVEFPESEFVPRARERLRELRQQNPEVVP
ncbi:MAG: hypothetical protein D6715_08970 [Calditrichaeota bacterium]|nr:MAG: hypothetical protein D6715_08970 [Calditrichota bacterium]